MKKPPIVLELTWGEAANLYVAVGTAKIDHFTPAARGNLTRAIAKLGAAIPWGPDPNALYLVVRGQTPAELDPAQLETPRDRRRRRPARQRRRP